MGTSRATEVLRAVRAHQLGTVTVAAVIAAFLSGCTSSALPMPGALSTGGSGTPSVVAASISPSTFPTQAEAELPPPSDASIDAIRALARADGACIEECGVVGISPMRHSQLGALWLVTLQDPSGSAYGILDRAGQVLRSGSIMNTSEIRAIGQDAAGTYFLSFNPGRYDGVVVLRPTTTGYTDLGSDATASGAMEMRFYPAWTEDDDGDGILSVVVGHAEGYNDPDGSSWTVEHEWNGTDFIPMSTSAPTPFG